MARVDLNAFLKSPKKPRVASRPSESKSAPVVGWIKPAHPDVGLEFGHEVVRRVFGTAYIPLDIVIMALMSSTATIVAVVDEGERRVKVVGDGVSGDLLRPLRQGEVGRSLQIDQAYVPAFESALTRANTATWSPLQVQTKYQR